MDEIQFKFVFTKINVICNDGVMPTNLTSTEKLFQKHYSKPYNPKLADIFSKSGMIEAWGRGFDKIKEACKKYDGPLPEYDISEDGIRVLCKACDKYLNLLHGNSEEINSLTSNDRINERKNEGAIRKNIRIFKRYYRNNKCHRTGINGKINYTDKKIFKYTL